MSRFHTIHFLLKENRGRDISALLVTANCVVEQYKYICFLHDKKKHEPTNEEETALWIKNLWRNMFGSESYIEQVIQKFEENDKLGVLALPDPIGEHFCNCYGYGWHGIFQITKQLTEAIELKCDIDESKHPITIGTTIWFRVKAL